MALYIYHRVSTDEQDFIQQKYCVDSYLERNSIKECDIKEQLIEKMTGVDEHTHRKFAKLLAKLKEGDTLFFSELSRIGRNMSDLFNIVNHCCANGVILMQCKDSTRIENETIGGKALLFALSLAAEIEVANIRQRTQMALDARKKLLEDKGAFISKSGNVCTKLGRPKITPEERKEGVTGDNSAAVQGIVDRSILWREQSAAYKWVAEKLASGMSRNQMLEELQSLYNHAPEKFCTRKGTPVTRSILDRWCREMNPLVLVG